MQALLDAALAAGSGAGAGEDILSPAFAAKLDAADELAHLRGEFRFPRTEETASVRKPGDPCIYLCGNSLGLQPKRVRDYVHEELDKWETYGASRPARAWLLCPSPNSTFHRTALATHPSLTPSAQAWRDTSRPKGRG